MLRQSGRDRAVIVTGGVTLAEALTAYEELRQEGLAVSIIDLFSIQPIDREALMRLAALLVALSSRLRITTCTAGSGMQCLAHWPRSVSRSINWRCAKFRKVVSPTNCSNATAFLRTR